MKKIIVVLSILAGAVYAETIVFYGFDDSCSPSSVSPYIVAADINFGRGIREIPGFSVVKHAGKKSLFFNNSGLYSRTEKSAIGNNGFISFRITVHAGYKANLSTLSFYILRRPKAGAGAPDCFSIYTSRDNYRTSVGDGTIPVAVDEGSSDFVLQTINLSKEKLLQSFMGDIEFRIYLWPSQGHGAVNTRQFRLDSLCLEGTVFSNK
ncbi:MAG: hypothetical protein WC958_05810 [Dehalococcoidales bacterium]